MNKDFGMEDKMLRSFALNATIFGMFFIIGMTFVLQKMRIDKLEETLQTASCACPSNPTPEPKQSDSLVLDPDTESITIFGKMDNEASCEVLRSNEGVLESVELKDAGSGLVRFRAVLENGKWRVEEVKE